MIMEGEYSISMGENPSTCDADLAMTGGDGALKRINAPYGRDLVN